MLNNQNHLRIEVVAFATLCAVLIISMGMQMSQQNRMIQDLKKGVEELEEENENLSKENDELLEREGELLEREGDLLERNNELSIKLEKYKTKLQEQKLEEAERIAQQKLEEERKRNTIQVQATAYTANDAGMDGKGITFTGTKVKQGKTIAVDPSVIPLGSKVRIESETYPSINGVYIAGDTGGAIKGNRVDIYFVHKNDALQFGRRDVTVTILERGDWK